MLALSAKDGDVTETNAAFMCPLCDEREKCASNIKGHKSSRIKYAGSNSRHTAVTVAAVSNTKLESVYAQF